MEPEQQVTDSCRHLFFIKQKWVYRTAVCCYCGLCLDDTCPDPSRLYLDTEADWEHRESLRNTGTCASPDDLTGHWFVSAEFSNHSLWAIECQRCGRCLHANNMKRVLDHDFVTMTVPATHSPSLRQVVTFANHPAHCNRMDDPYERHYWVRMPLCDNAMLFCVGCGVSNPRYGEERPPDAIYPDPNCSPANVSGHHFVQGHGLPQCAVCGLVRYPNDRDTPKCNECGRFPLLPQPAGCLSTESPGDHLFVDLVFEANFWQRDYVTVCVVCGKTVGAACGRDQTDYRGTCGHRCAQRPLQVTHTFGVVTTTSYAYGAEDVRKDVRCVVCGKQPVDMVYTRREARESAHEGWRDVTTV